MTHDQKGPGMTTAPELDWLVRERPVVDPPRPDATRRARADLLALANAGAGGSTIDAQRSESPAVPTLTDRRTTRRRRAPLVVAAAAVAAAAVGVASVGLPSTGNDTVDSAISADPVGAEVLVETAESAVAAPADAEGDATMSVHTTTSGAGTFTGADLFLDDGRYFYGAAVEGQGPHGALAEADASLQPVLDAARAVAELEPEAARTSFFGSVLAGLQSRPPYTDDGAASDAEARAAADVEAERVAAQAAAGGDGPLPTRQDDLIWATVIDAFAGANGDAAVRAGLLRVLAGIETISVTEGTDDTGRPIVTIANVQEPDGEPFGSSIVIDAETGVLRSYTGGDAVITYEVTRVIAADVIG